MKTHPPTKARHGMRRKLGRLMAAASIAALGAGFTPRMPTPSAPRASTRTPSASTRPATPAPR